MQFRTQVPISSQDPKIHYDSKVLLLGSCFVENMAKKLEYYKFSGLLNPFGILFHPAAIHNFLNQVQAQKTYTASDLFFHNETWHCFEAHSILNNTDKDAILDDLNAAVERTHQFISSASHVIITPGTAWGYRYRESGKVVANCHKIPQKAFEKELLRVEQDLAGCVRIIRELNPEAAVIFTLSPVRHLRDGFEENQRSKARLLEGIHAARSMESSVSYFPSYEIMMDELRDYRFYSEDMVHPNKIAVDYIWERFRDTWIAKEAMAGMEQVEVIRKGLAHKPFNESSKAHADFLRSLQDKIEAFQRTYPKIKF